MRRGFLAACVMVLATCAPVPGHAATTFTVHARDNSFDATPLIAATGDTVRFTLDTAARNQHDIATYQGPAFDTGTMAPGVPYDVAFAGGTIRYRCTIHGHLDASGACTGMCGVVTDSPPSVPTPTITTPSEGQVVRSAYVDFGGSVSQGVASIRLRDVDTGAILGVRGANTTIWQLTTVKFPNGTHHVAVQGFDSEGFQSAYSATTSFVVSYADSTPPAVGISSPNSPTTNRPLKFGGTAKDDVGVTSLDISIVDALGRAQSSPDMHEDGFPGADVHFYGSVPVLPGRYTITVVAQDDAGHRTSVSKDVIVLI